VDFKTKVLVDLIRYIVIKFRERLSIISLPGLKAVHF